MTLPYVTSKNSLTSTHQSQTLRALLWELIFHEPNKEIGTVAVKNLESIPSVSASSCTFDEKVWKSNFSYASITTGRWFESNYNCSNETETQWLVNKMNVSRGLITWWSRRMCYFLLTIEWLLHLVPFILFINGKALPDKQSICVNEYEVINQFYNHQLVLINTNSKLILLCHLLKSCISTTLAFSMVL